MVVSIGKLLTGFLEQFEYFNIFISEFPQADYEHLDFGIA